MQALTIILSEDNQNADIRTLDDLLNFVLNELQNANIGALLKIEDIKGD